MVWDSSIHDIGRGQPANESGSPESLGRDSSASWLPQMNTHDSPILSPWRPQEMDNDHAADWPGFADLQSANEIPDCLYDDIQLFAEVLQEETDLNDGLNFSVTGSEDITGSEEVSFAEKDPQAQIEGQIAMEAPYSSLNTDTMQIHKMPPGHSPTLERVVVSSKEKTTGELSRQGQPSRAAPAKRRRGKGKALCVSPEPQADDASRVTKKQRAKLEEDLRKALDKVGEEDKKHNAPPGSFGVFLTNTHMHMPRRLEDELQNQDEVTKGGRACCFCSQWNLKCSVNEPCEGHWKYCKITKMVWDWSRRLINEINKMIRRGFKFSELPLLQKLINRAVNLCLVCMDLVPEAVRCKYYFAQEELERHQWEIPSFKRGGLLDRCASRDTYPTEYVSLATDFESLCKKVRGTIRDIERTIVERAEWCVELGDEPAGLHALLIIGSAWQADLE